MSQLAKPHSLMSLHIFAKFGWKKHRLRTDKWPVCRTRNVSIRHGCPRRHWTHKRVLSGRYYIMWMKHRYWQKNILVLYLDQILKKIDKIRLWSRHKNAKTVHRDIDVWDSNSMILERKMSSCYHDHKLFWNPTTKLLAWQKCPKYACTLWRLS